MIEIERQTCFEDNRIFQLFSHSDRHSSNDAHSLAEPIATALEDSVDSAAILSEFESGNTRSNFIIVIMYEISPMTS